MNRKRIRAVNWDEEEKQLFRSVLNKYKHVIENKCIDTNTNKVKTKAWEEVYKKFNELNGRHRQLSQLKIQWKIMKVHARKTYSTFQKQKEATKTGGGARPTTNDADICRETIEDIDTQLTDAQKSTPLAISNDETVTATPMEKNMGTIPAKKVPIKSNISENGLKSRKDHDDYVSSMISHSKMLKGEEHRRRMEMAEEEHSIKIAIQKEKLKCAILEREILELKKVFEEENLLNL